MKKFKRIICVFLVLFLLFSVQFGCVNSSMFTEEQHLERISKRINKKREIWEHGSYVRHIDEQAIEIDEFKFTDFRLYPLYNENEELSYVLVEFEPYGFGLILISKFNFGLLDACLGNTMYCTDGTIIWYPYETERNLYGHHYYVYKYDESGNIVYYNHSPYYISNNLQERKYLLLSNSGGFVPAVKHGEIYINLINNKEIAFINGKAEGYIPCLRYVKFGHGRSYDL